jgi:hypothetical protein
MNLLFSFGVERDKELEAEGHTFLGAGEGPMVGGEAHVWLKKGEKLGSQNPPREKPMSEKQTIEAESFLDTLEDNIENEKLSDAEFREFVRNTMPAVQRTEHARLVGYCNGLVARWGAIKGLEIGGPVQRSIGMISGFLAKR